MEKSAFASTLISWYHEHHRKLPWRQTRDPYKIWLSEVILQQTRVSQGLPYYHSFCENFPGIFHLARASEQEVLRLWQGLGYYSRARNLHRCAQLVVDKYQGRFPDNYQDLIRLPGIGDYSAAAIASFAFGQPAPVVDGNVFRVLSRVFGIEDDISMPKTRKVFKEISGELMKGAPPDQFNQAIMEFGALNCTPKNPKCISCPFTGCCKAYLSGTQLSFPVKSKKVRVRHRYFYYYVIKSGPSLLLKRRKRKDIWQGLYDFMLLEPESQSDPLELLDHYMPHGSRMNGIEIREPSATYRHKLTHQQINACFVIVEAGDKGTFDHWKRTFELKEFNLSEVHRLPKPILINNYLKADIF